MRRVNTLTSSLVDLSARWLADLEIRPSTYRAYEFEAHRLARWASEAPDARLSALPTEFLTEFLDLLAATREEDFARAGLTRPAKDSSLLQAKRILSAWFEWAGASGLVPAAIGYACRRWRVPEGRILQKQKSPAQRQGRAKAGSRDHIRNEFIVALARWAGARPQDIANLRRSDVRMSGKLLRVRLPNGKGAPVDTFLPPAAAKLWKTLSKRLRSSEFAVTRTGTGERLTPSRITRIVAEIGAESENTRALRMEGIRQFYDSGWPEQTIRAQMRRESVRVGLAAESKSVRLGRVRQLSQPNS